MSQGVFPYGGNTEPNSGYTGSDTSRERALSEDASGTTAHRQRDVLRLLNERGTQGATWREVASILGLHHGQASGALSGLHKAGKVARIGETRQQCSVYVTPEHLQDRWFYAQGHTSTSRLLGDMAGLLTRFSHDCVHTPYSEAGCIQCETREVLRRYEARG